jgi:hypothetical protein
METLRISSPARLHEHALVHQFRTRNDRLKLALLLTELGDLLLAD